MCDPDPKLEKQSSYCRPSRATKPKNKQSLPNRLIDRINTADGSTKGIADCEKYNVRIHYY
tara:strand:+ start:94182 stop:94364 length:183 start_codon:yes stop_codon:yes gene_type:complete